MNKKVLGFGGAILAIVVLVAIFLISGQKNEMVMPKSDTQVIAQGDTVIETTVPESESKEEVFGENQTETENQPKDSVNHENPSTESGLTEEPEQPDEPSSPNQSNESNEPSEPEDSSPEENETPDSTLGNELTFDESITSNNGVDIPVLNQFNDAGLDPEGADDNGMQDWFGYVGDSDSPGYVNVTMCADAMNELTEAMDITGGFLPQEDHISFSFTDVYASNGDIELRRDFENGYYTIGINYDMSDSESFYSVEDGMDALTLLCSVVSSTPAELAEFLYQESFVVEECMTAEDTWVTVGDCQVQWGGYGGNDADELVYKIKGK